MADWGRGNHKYGSSIDAALSGTYYKTSAPNIGATTPYSLLLNGSYDNVTYSHRRGIHGYTDGGPWFLKKRKEIFRCSKITIRTGAGLTAYRGDWKGQHLDSVGILPTFQTQSNIDKDGAVALSLITPTVPTASLGTALGELAQDGLPAFVGSAAVKNRVKVARSAGDEYLNVQFGWLPLVSDLQAFAYNVKHANKIVSQFKKDSEKKIKRRYSFDTVTSVVVTQGSGFIQPTTLNQRWAGTTSMVRTEKKWFEGAFRYFVPMGDDLVSRMQRYEQLSNQLLGTRVTPEVVWNCSPWSWAIDWFVDIGSIMTNISALGHDGLVLEYGYQMRSYDAILGTQGSIIPTINCKGGDFLWETMYSTKQRQPANPYGFGSNGLPTTRRQLAITAALAAGRSPF
jgi:hypothetical protein